MTDKIEITDWAEEEDVSGSTAWAAEWFSPDEKIEDETELSKVGVHVIYKNEKHFTWFYPQIRIVLEEKKVKEFVKFNGIDDASEEDIIELRDFFFHFLQFVNHEVELEGPTTFEPENIAESMSDADLDDIEEELTNAGMKDKLH
jgi:hypothetical protein